MAGNTFKYPETSPGGDIEYPEAKPDGYYIIHDIATGNLSTAPAMPDGVVVGQFCLFTVLEK